MLFKPGMILPHSHAKLIHITLNAYASFLVKASDECMMCRTIKKIIDLQSL